MAPSSNTTTKAMQQNQPRPAMRKPVVPVIPITYTQRRKKAVEPEQPKKEPEPESVADESVSSPSLPFKTPLTGSPDTRNASDDHESSKQASPVVSALSTVATPPHEVEAEVPTSQDSLNNTYEKPASVLSDPHSSTSHTTFQMPPHTFIPAYDNRPPLLPSEYPRPQLPHMMNGQFPTHHAHPSASSLMFGGYSDSNTSSPAPPTSAGFGPPPLPFQQQGPFGRPGAPMVNGGHFQYPSNSFVPMDPHAAPAPFPRPDGFDNQSFGLNGFDRRPLMMFGPADVISPSPTPLGTNSQGITSYDPSTPQSLQGSQPSTTNDQDNNVPGFYGQHPTAVVSNGSNGHMDGVRLYQVPRQQAIDSQPTALTPIFPPPGMPLPQIAFSDDRDKLINHLLSQFADPYLADCNVELRYADDRSCPVRIPGHSIVLARSPALKNLIDAQAREPSSDGSAVKTLLITSEDCFLRSDAFWMAVQRLYGGPLLDLSIFATMGNLQHPPPSPMSMPGSPFDHFELGLAYAAAGCVLGISQVMDRGCDIAAEYVTWETLEKTLEFVLSGGVEEAWFIGGYSPHDVPVQSPYGHNVNKMIYRALEFIVANFPVNFELDTSVNHLAISQRLPVVPDELKQQSLTSIRFGDHPIEAIPMRVTPSSINALLSKALLDLPFPLLKYILQNPCLGNVSGWASSSLRQKVMQTVISERERRRLKAYQHTNVTNEQRSDKYTSWNAVGWEESVSSTEGTDEIATLHRKWVDFLLPGKV